MKEKQQKMSGLVAIDGLFNLNDSLVDKLFKNSNNKAREYNTLLMEDFKKS